MLRNLKTKHLQVKLVEDVPELPQLPKGETTVDVTADPADVVGMAALGVCAIIGTYMAADTVRQSTIHIVKAIVR